MRPREPVGRLPAMPISLPHVPIAIRASELGLSHAILASRPFISRKPTAIAMFRASRASCARLHTHSRLPVLWALALGARGDGVRGVSLALALALAVTNHGI